MKTAIFSLILFSFFLTNKIEIKDSWIRTGAKGMNTALFFNVVNNSNTPDTLYSAKSNLSNIVELHETFTDGDKMGMRKVPYVVIKPKSTFNFKPGGNHIMLIDLKEKLIQGKTGDVELYFKKAGKIKLKAEVKR